MVLERSIYVDGEGGIDLGDEFRESVRERREGSTSDGEVKE